MKNSSFRSNKKYFHLCIDYHVEPFFKELSWVFLQKKLQKLSVANDIEVQCLVMMDTHVHILFATTLQNENFFCDQLQISLDSIVLNETHCEPIMNYSQYLNTYKYICQNPVQADIVKRVEDYTFSSLQILLGKTSNYCFVHDQLGFIQNPIHILKWLNSSNDYKTSQMKLLRQSSSLLM